jgi:hypothetical protein
LGKLKGYFDLIFTALLIVIAVPAFFISSNCVFMPINDYLLVAIFAIFYGCAVLLSVKKRKHRKNISRYSLLALPIISLIGSFEVAFVCDISIDCLVIILWIIWIATLILFFSALTKKVAKIVMGIIFGLAVFMAFIASVTEVFLLDYGVTTINTVVSEDNRYSAELRSIEVMGEASTIVYARSNENDFNIGIGIFGNKAQRIGRVGNKSEHIVKWNGDILVVDHLKYEVSALLSDDYDYGMEDVLSSITGAYIPLRKPDVCNSPYTEDGTSCLISCFELSSTEKENVLSDATYYDGWNIVDEAATEKIKGLGISDIDVSTLSDNDIYLIYDEIQMDMGFPDESLGVMRYILILYSANENKLYIFETT